MGLNFFLFWFTRMFTLDGRSWPWLCHRAGEKRMEKREVFFVSFNKNASSNQSILQSSLMRARIGE